MIQPNIVEASRALPLWLLRLLPVVSRLDLKVGRPLFLHHIKRMLGEDNLILNYRLLIPLIVVRGARPIILAEHLVVLLLLLGK